MEKIILFLIVGAIVAWGNWELALKGAYREGYFARRTKRIGKASLSSWSITLVCSIVVSLMDGIAGSIGAAALFAESPFSRLGFVTGIVVGVVANVVAFVLGTRSEYQERD